MTIKHSVIKSSGEVGLASEWNDDHVISNGIDLSDLKFILPYQLGGTQPELTAPGEIKIWESGTTFDYDDYDGVIDTEKWNATTTGSGMPQPTVGETASYIYGNIRLYGEKTGNGWRTATIESNHMPQLADLTEIRFRADLNVAGMLNDINRAYTRLYIFGILVKQLLIGSDSSEWKAIKNPDGTWEIWDDDVNVLHNQVAITNTIKVVTAYNETMYPGSFGTEYNGYGRIFTVHIGGGTYLMVRGSAKTYLINFDLL
jgi:hypothetical protein